MAKKNRDPESSLELLLDTMCNTFGGVIFIAISLAISMSLMSRAANALQPVPEETVRAMEEELRNLSGRNEELEKQFSVLEGHPARKQIREKLLLDRKISEEKIHLELQELKKVQLREKRDRQEKVLAEELRKLQAEKRRRDQMEKELRDLQTRLAAMSREADASSGQTMTFRVMEKYDKIPYFIIVKENRLWRIGPESQPDHTFKPHPDCTFTEQLTQKEKTVICTPAAGKGIPILQNGTISPAAESLIRAIPEDRLARFCLAKDSIRDFCVFREHLKKKKIIHGLIPLYQDTFTYSVTNRKMDYYY